MTTEASMGSHVMLYPPATAHGDLQEYGSYWRALKGAESTRGDCGAESTRVTVVLRAHRLYSIWGAQRLQMLLFCSPSRWPQHAWLLQHRVRLWKPLYNLHSGVRAWCADVHSQLFTRCCVRGLQPLGLWLLQHRVQNCTEIICRVVLLLKTSSFKSSRASVSRTGMAQRVSF